jgi:apolipoprotein N-acyltransferase
MEYEFPKITRRRLIMKEERASTSIQSDRWSYLWLAIGTLLGFFWVIPLTIWLSPVFMLRFMRTQKVWRGFILVWLASFVTIAITLRNMLPMPLPVYLVTMAISSLTVGGLPYLADRLLAPRLRGFAATLVFPLAVTALDYIGAATNPMGSIGAQAYGQYGNLAFMQLLSITGMWGIVFLANWFGAIVNWAWERSFDWPKIRRGAALYASILLLVMLYGGARLAFAPAPTGTVRMHGITAVDMQQTLPELHQAAGRDDWQVYRQMSAEIQDRYFEGTVREARAGAQLVHWPEMAVMVVKEDEAAFIARGQQIARDEGIYLAMAMAAVYEDGRPGENKLIVVDPAGEIALEHHKYGNAAQEGFKPGDGLLHTVETPFGTLSGIICNDTDHQEVVTQAGRNGTDILLSPSLEWRGIDPMHAHMATYRAIENGVSIVRQADNGLSIVADPYGRTLAAMDHFSANDRVMVAQVPTRGVFTIYPIIGDLFGWLAVVGFVVVAVWAVIRGRRAARAESSQLEGQALA